MKTSEIINLMKAYCDYLNSKSLSKNDEYEVFVNDDSVSIKNGSVYYNSLIWVSTTSLDEYRFEMKSSVEYDDYEVVLMIQSLVEYSKTPLEERKDEKLDKREEKRWRIYFGTSDISYLNQDKETGTYALSTERETNSYKTKFTRSEIEEWAGTKNDDVIDWIIDKFGEEVQ